MFSPIAIAHPEPARRWSALTSFTLEAALVAAVLAYPLFHPESLPPPEHRLFLPLRTAAPTRALENAPRRPGSSSEAAPIAAVSHPLYRPGRAAPAEDRGQVPAPDIGWIAATNPGGVLESIVGGPFRPMPHAPLAALRPRVSVVMEGNLIYRVEPRYPPIAKQLRIEGTVVVKAFISREGTIERAEAESGQALLAEAAIRAVRQWRYRPYYLNHEPIEVETEITVNFVLER